MDSFPNEFLAHHLPLLFVAGINPPSTPDNASPTTPTPSAENDPFATLLLDLRKSLGVKKVHGFWNMAKGQRPDFHTVLVDKAIKLPPRKSSPPANAPPGAPYHSPLSPLSPNSPVFPDGMIAPIWIRKHRDLVPAVFVLVLYLYEPPSLQSPLGNGPSVERSTEEMEAERAADGDLIRQVTERKRSMSERGGKLAVVLLASRRLLDNPSLDPRLSAIRRASGLDSRASLFVLSPVPPNEVAQFAHTLKSELYDSAMDYYRDHARRARRKRGRPSVTANSSAYVAAQSGGITPLSQQGWVVRADFKLATFAELRQETEVARKHFEDTWETLSSMFGNTALLPPRTRRWAEAKVLTDCVNFKICKLYLYDNDSQRAVSQLYKHISRFRDLCNGWGIGDDTFEFWSWLSKQYRLFGDLIDLACKNGFRVQMTLPGQGGIDAQKASSKSMPSTTGIVTSNVLQHAGFYYFASAECAIERRNKYRDAQAGEEKMQVTVGDSFQPSLALAHEKKVNHGELIIELYTKAYEIFKRFSLTRMSLYLASRIALVHQDVDDHDMSLRFFDRIAATYRKEHFRPVLQSILIQAYEAAYKTKRSSVVIRTGLELLSQGDDLESQLRTRIYSELRSLLDSTAVTDSNEVEETFELEKGCSPLNSSIVFWKGSAHLGEPIMFQLIIAAPPMQLEGNLQFDQLRCTFSNGTKLVIDHEDDESELLLHTVDVDVVNDEVEVTKNTSLEWRPGSKVLIKGAIASNKSGNLTLDVVEFVTRRNGWHFILPTYITPAPTLSWLKVDGDVGVYLPLVSLAGSCAITLRPMKITFSLKHERSALLDESFLIELVIVNEDSYPATASVDARLVAPDPKSVEDTITIGSETTSTIMKGVQLGDVAPHSTLTKRLILRCSGTLGPRRIDCQLHCEPMKTEDNDDDDPLSSITPFEFLRTSIIPTEQPWACSFEIDFLRKTLPFADMLDFTCVTEWEGASVAVGAAYLQPNGVFDLRIRDLTISCEGIEDRVRVLDPGVDEDDESFEVTDLDHGGIYCLPYQIQLAIQNRNLQTPLRWPHLIVSWQRIPCQENDVVSKTVIPFPALHPPLPQPLVTAQVPFHTRFNQLTPFSYTISNPTEITLDLSLQVETSDYWLFSGPRKIDRILLLAQTTRQVSFRAVAVGVGYIEVPRLRVFERLRSSEDVHLESKVDEEGRSIVPPPPALRELEVVRDHIVGQVGMNAEGEIGEQDLTTGPLRVLVLPA